MFQPARHYVLIEKNHTMELWGEEASYLLGVVGGIVSTEVKQVASLDDVPVDDAQATLTVFTDFVDGMWRDPSTYQKLGKLTRAMRVCAVNPLPSHMWRFSILAEFRRAIFESSPTMVSNDELNIVSEEAGFFFENLSGSSIKMPIVHDIREWLDFFEKPQCTINGYLMYEGEENTKEFCTARMAQTDYSMQRDRFMAQSSAVARELLDIVRSVHSDGVFSLQYLIQWSNIVCDSKNAAAELYLSGLVKREGNMLALRDEAMVAGGA